MEEEDNTSVIPQRQQDFGKMQYGCEPYRRQCKLQAPCCDQIFSCRHCHNEATGENFFHCQKCGSCYSVGLRGNHSCVENSMKNQCPICYEYLFGSVKGTTVMKCGHTMHMECNVEMMKQNQYHCPSCSKTVFDMSRTWERLNEEIEAIAMSEEYQYKSLERLLNLTTSPLEKSKDALSIAAQKLSDKPMEKCSDMESPLCQEKSEHVNSARSGKSRFITRNELESPKRDKNRYDLQREIIEALFTVSERVEKAPRITCKVKEVGRSGAFGQVVVEPFKDHTTERIIANPEPQISEDDKEDSYQALRKATKENWITLKEYHKAAVDAFAEDDYARAYKLLEEGNLFKEKAQEANENSAQKLLEIKDDAEDVPLDLHDHEPKEAIRLPRLHLTSLCGIPSFQHLKVMVGTNAEDAKRQAPNAEDAKRQAQKELVHLKVMVGTNAEDAKRQAQKRLGFREDAKSPIFSNEKIFFRFRRSVMELFLYSSCPSLRDSTLFFVRSLNYGRVPVDLSTYEIVGHSSVAGWFLLIADLTVFLFDGIGYFFQLPDLPYYIRRSVKRGCFVIDENSASVLIIAFFLDRFFVFRHTTHLEEYWVVDTEYTYHQHQPEGFCYNDAQVGWVNLDCYGLTVISSWQDHTRFIIRGVRFLPVLGRCRVACGISHSPSLEFVLVEGDWFSVYEVIQWETPEGFFVPELRLLQNWHIRGQNFYITIGFQGLSIPVEDERNKIFVAGRNGAFVSEVSINEEDGVLVQYTREIFRTNDALLHALWFHCDVERFLL